MSNVKLVPTLKGKISFDHILLAHERIRHYLHTTPVFQNETLNGLCRTDDWPMAISCKGASSKAAALSARLRLVYARLGKSHLSEYAMRFAQANSFRRPGRLNREGL